jgi:hypothetical protein
MAPSRMLWSPASINFRSSFDSNSWQKMRAIGQPLDPSKTFKNTKKKYKKWGPSMNRNVIAQQNDGHLEVS